ncbi:LexA family protein [Aureimonas leprariae]|uniref:Translesion error-prone DNA polymerase V autoproteolytic subunit n=1 Tax=Plantimonas leprariae TaxID=2615207 RepID=A0A7V7TXP5_9HYPH|nr:translesion error-prone DNA polymerase V autoproteolytic subunit [Aureimonas leprariae]KAB0681310.1 translesion error-prone DNA polymerase V autoproteolytic subunit [Aureimonas leprariae]
MLARVVVGPEIPLPQFLHGLCAGFPSPADDFLDESIDLSRLLIRNAPATFLWKVDGSSCIEFGIFDGDLLVVDRSHDPRNGDVVVAIVNGERSLKKLILEPGRPLQLAMGNRDMGSYELPAVAEVEIWGVVTFNVHWLRQPVARRSA